MQRYQHEVVNTNSDLAFKLKLFSGGIIECPPHWHNCLEIVHISRGALRFTLNGTRHSMGDGDVIVINPKDVHSTHTLKRLDAALIQVPYDFFKSIAFDMASTRFDFNTAAATRSQKKKMRGHADTLAEMYETYRMKNRGYGLKAVSLLCDFLHRLLQNHSGRHGMAAQKTEKYLHRLESVTSFVLEHYKDPITVRQMSAIAYLNPEYFSRFFRKYMGITPIEYLNLVRIQNVAAGLLATDISVGDLAAMHGCNDYKLFLRRFRKTFGCTPRQYRREPMLNDVWSTSDHERVHVS